MTTLIRSMNTMLRLLVPGAVLILMPGHSHAQSGPDYGPLREAVQSSGPIVVSVLLSSEAPMAARVQADSEIGNLQDVEVIHSFVTSPGMSVRVTSEEAVEALVNHPMVERVDISPAGAAHLMDSRSIVGAEEAYAAGFDGEGSTVSILDTGIERNHTDLADDLVAEACICNTGIGCCPNGMSEQIGPGSAPDDTGHGTHVSGIVTSDGTLAPRGIAPQAGVVMVRMMNGALFDSADDITASLEWVLENHPESDSVNMSLGTFQRYPANCDIATDTWTPPAFIVNMANAVQALRDAGVTAVASSGNDADKAQTAAPACLSNVVAVGNTTKDNMVSSSSNSDEGLDVLAPGTSILSTYLSNSTAVMTGTSMAAPHVAAAAALLRQSDPELTPGQVQSCLQTSPTQITDTNGITRPLLHIPSALDACGEVPPAALTGELVLFTDWGDGYCMGVWLTNDGTEPTTSWDAVIDLQDTVIDDLWNANFSPTTGPVTLTPLSWNSVINPGETNQSIGFCATRPEGGDAVATFMSATAEF